MAIAFVCPVLGVNKSDPRLAELKKNESYKDYTEEFLANALHLFKKQHKGDPQYPDDWVPESPSERAVFTRFIKYSLGMVQRKQTKSTLSREKLNEIYNCLYDIYPTPELLEDRINMLANKFLDELDKKAGDKADVYDRRKLLKSLQQDGKNGFMVIMERVFNSFNKYLNPHIAYSRWLAKNPGASEIRKKNALKSFEYAAKEYKKILENKNLLAALVATKVGNDEGFKVRTRNFEVNFEAIQDEDLVDTENAATGQNDGIDGTDSIKGDRYSDFRILKLMETLSPRARKLISRIPRLKQNGKVMEDDLGETQYLSQRQVATVLNKVLTYSSPDSFMEDLKSAADIYPWLSGLVKKLEDSKRDRATLYVAFKKAQSVVVYADRNKSSYRTSMANSRSRGRSLMQEAGNNLVSGLVLSPENAIVTSNGWLKSSGFIAGVEAKAKKIAEVIDDIKDVSMIVGTTKVTSANSKYKGLAPDVAIKQFFTDNPTISEQVSGLLRGLGFTVSAKDVEEIALQTMTKYSFRRLIGRAKAEGGASKNKLSQLMVHVQDALSIAKRVAVGSKDMASTGQSFYNTAGSPLTKITDLVALSRYYDVESRYRSADKSMSSYSNPSLLHQVTDELFNAMEDEGVVYRKRLMDDYGQYEGMAITENYVENGVQKSRIRLTGWLKYLWDSSLGTAELAMGKFRLYSAPGFNKREYASLSPKQKLTASLVQFFDAGRTFQNEAFAGYEVPIQADYSTAYDFILAPKFTQDEILEALTDEILCELERIADIEQRTKNDPYAKNRISLSVWEKKGIKIQLFPALNKNGFREGLSSLDESGKREYIKKAVAEELGKQVKKDIATITRSGILSNSLLSSKGLDFYTEDGKVSSLSEEKVKMLENWSMNTFFARSQMVKLFDGGLQNFNDLTEFRKRNMLLHAPRTAMYTRAWWGEEQMKKDYENVAYIEDEVAESKFIKDIENVLKQLLEQDYITKRQYDTMLSSYKKIKSTDGQGFRTLQSYREIMIMSDQWTDKLEESYKRILKGKPTNDDIDVFLAVVKPVATGFEHLSAADTGGKKPVKLTFLHKYSEVVLLPVALAQYCLSAQSVPLRAFAESAEKLGQEGVDLFLFHSGVKVGAHSILQPLMRWRDVKEDKEKGLSADEVRRSLGWDGKEPLTNRVFKTEEAIQKYLTSAANTHRWNIHKIPYKYFGIAASTPPHSIGSTLTRASQMEKTAMANIEKGDEIVINGKKVDAVEYREKYYEIKTARIIAEYQELRNLFNNTDELDRIFQEELADKSYQPRELRFALAHLKDGSFALPLFSPNVGHQVEQMLLSIIKKRLTKIKGRGAAILVSSALGMEVDASPFEGEKGFPENSKLGVEFRRDKNGNAIGVKWFDAGFGLPEQLREFADENGNIPFERLWGSDGTGNTEGLVFEGKIPREALFGTASRTPSDAEHSAVPYRVKWFSSAIESGSGKIAREAMIMTGQDFDGDKLRVDVKEYKVGWDEQAMQADYDAMVEAAMTGTNDEVSLVRTILGQENEGLPTYEEWSKWIKSKGNERGKKYRKVLMESYDFSKPASQQSAAAQHNGQIDILFAILTSDKGSMRNLIPGGCDESKIYAKSLHLTRLCADKNVVQKIFDVTTRSTKKDGLGYDAATASKMLANTESRYNAFTQMSPDDLDVLVKEVSEDETPFSLTDSQEAFITLMGGAEMIGIYAMYNSALQMFQRLNLSYQPDTWESGDPINLTLFGHTIDKLCQVRGRTRLENGKPKRGLLNSLGLASLLNAAVDNGKDPILGYLHQSPALAEITVFLSAAGYNEEDIHLLINQPAVIELQKRMQDSGRSLSAVAEELIDEMQLRPGFEKMKFSAGLKKVAAMTKSDFVKDLDKEYGRKGNPDEDNYDAGEGFVSHTAKDGDILNRQTAILYFLSKVSSAANDFSELVRATRPESDSGAIGSSIASVINRESSLMNIRKKMNPLNRHFYIWGADDLMRKKNVQFGMSDEAISEAIGNQLPEVVALNTLMIDSTNEMLAPYFPQAKATWYNTAIDIAQMYRYRRAKDSSFNAVLTEMVLWKLLKNKAFIGDSVENEAKRNRVEVPAALMDLKTRINKMEELHRKLAGVDTYFFEGKEYYKDENGIAQEVERDKEAEWLMGNVFLHKLFVTSPENSRVNPRISFNLDGAAIEGQADLIRAHWANMLKSPYENTRQLAIDLFTYNLYNSGFGFGMYEFAHFAPMAVIIQTPGYLEALKRLSERDEWTDADDIENFTNQYIMNHWGDDKFLYSIKETSLNGVRHTETEDGKFIMCKNSMLLQSAMLLYNGFIVIKNNGKETLYKIVSGYDDEGAQLKEMPKLGVRLEHGQATLQYNPDISYMEIQPTIPGNDSSWGNLDPNEDDYWAESDISNPPVDDAGSNYNPLNSILFGAASALNRVKKSDEKISAQTRIFTTKAVMLAEKNKKLLSEQKEDTSKKKILKYSGKWTRNAVKSDALSLYIFTDNTDRDSGSGLIPDDSWYSQRYGTGHHFPTMTTAVIRGLDNARPISTQRWYHDGAKGETGRWTDADFNEFKAVVDVEFEDIKAAWDTGKFNRIIFPADDGIFNSKISAITKTRTPQIYEYLQNKLKELNEYVNGSAESEAPQAPIVESTPASTAASSALTQEDFTNSALFGGGVAFSIARRDKNGNVVEEKVPATVNGIREARKQQAYVELNAKLREMLRELGVSVGVLDEFETRLALNGVTDFDSAKVTAEGLKELIRIADGMRGEYALPEEFAHLAIALLGNNNPLVQRLITSLRESEDALREAFEGQYDEYLQAYEGDMDMMVFEAAGKLVAKQMLYEQEISTRPIRSLIHRIIEAIKNFLRRFSIRRINNAILDAEQNASALAKELLAGRILDGMSVEYLETQGKMFQQVAKVKTDLSQKDDILNKLLKTETKKLDSYTARIGYDKKQISSSSEIQFVKNTIKSLESGIKNLQTEDAIVTYLLSMTQFLSDSYKSLDDSINGGGPVNVICKKLNIVRDTLYSVAKSISDIRKAIDAKEITDTAGIVSTMKTLESMLNTFFEFYNSKAMVYFEHMLANVYGDRGITVDIGRQKGRRITIHEMATRADRDISMASRWFNSIADSGDFVLSAIDEYTRNAKIQARQRFAELKPKAEAAYMKLVRLTGSKDQSFLFEKTLGSDGKYHKTGKYITAEQASRLSPAQKEYYDTMMSIKAEIDLCMPESLLQDRKIVMLRKRTIDKVNEAEGIKNKTMERWEGVKNAILDTSDNIDFDNYEVRVDFEGNQIDMLPVHYLAKGKNESYDDMSDDVVTSMLAYAGMAFEYHELNNVIALLENAKYMAAEREVVQHVGRKTKRESIETDDYEYHKPFTVKQARTRLQETLNDFFQMHIYGHIQANEGTVGNTKISKRKLVNSINYIVSLSQMALNLPQRFANVGVGMTQIGIETAGKDILNAKNIRWASGIWMKHTADRVAETGLTDYDNKLSLWLDFFDVHQDNGKKARDEHGRSAVGRFFNTSMLFAGLTAGEDYLASITALSIARQYKMKDASGKAINLWDAFEVKYVNPSSKEGAYLALRDGVTKADGSSFTAEDIKSITKQIASLNFEMQGIYNLDDRSAIQQYWFGALIIMYRKWIAPALKRRYARTHYNAMTDRWEEGYHTTLWHLLYDSYKDAVEQVSEQEGTNALGRMFGTLTAMISAVKTNREKLNDYEKSNIRKSVTELAIIVGLFLATAILAKLPPEEHDDDEPVSKFTSWLEASMMAQLFRLRTEIAAMGPTPAFVDESLKILKSPFAAIGPIRATFDAFNLLVPSNYFTYVRSGKDKGHTKAYKYFWDLPILSMRRKLQNFKNPSSLINYYKNDAF